MGGSDCTCLVSRSRQDRVRAKWETAGRMQNGQAGRFEGRPWGPRFSASRSNVQPAAYIGNHLPSSYMDSSSSWRSSKCKPFFSSFFSFFFSTLDGSSCETWDKRQLASRMGVCVFQQPRFRASTLQRGSKVGIDVLNPLEGILSLAARDTVGAFDRGSIARGHLDGSRARIARGTAGGVFALYSCAAGESLAVMKGSAKLITGGLGRGEVCVAGELGTVGRGRGGGY